jgi:hypothetical protein
MENAENAHPPVNVYTVEVGDVIYVDRAQAHGPKSNWDGGKCTVKKAVKRDQNIDFITVKPAAFGARLEKVIAHPDLLVPALDRPGPTSDCAISPAAASKAIAKRSSHGTATKQKGAHVNGQFESDGSESDGVTSSSSDDSDDDDIETHPNWPEVQRLDLSVTVVPSQPAVKIAVVVRRDPATCVDASKPSTVQNYEMLCAVLGVLQPELTNTLSLRRKSDPHAAVCTSLSWAWSGKSGFREAMRHPDMPSSLKRQKKTKGINSEWSKPGRKAWAKICRHAVKNAADQSKFDVEIVFGGHSESTGGAQQPSAQNRSTQVAKKQSARKHRRIQDSIMLLQAIFSIGEYSSYAAYERAREVFFEKFGNGRKRKKRGSADVSLSVPPTLASVKKARAKRLEQWGAVADRCILIDCEAALSNLSLRTETETETESESEETQKPIGVIHEYKSWLGNILMVMHGKGDCQIDLTGTSVDDDARADERDRDGWLHLGDHPDTFITLWADGFPAATKSAGNAGFYLNNPSQSLIRSGRSYPVPLALWQGGEEIAIRLYEALGAGKLTSDEYLRIEFKPFKTYIRVKLPLRALSADHKMWCELTGNGGSGSHARLHFLHPKTTIFLANDLVTYTACNLAEKLVWYMRTLHSGMEELKLLLGDPDKLLTHEEMKTWLTEQGLSDAGSRPACLARVKDAWLDVISPDHVIAELGKHIKDSKLIDIMSDLKKLTGMKGFPVFSVDNPKAFTLMETTCAELIGGSGGSGAVSIALARSHLKCLLELDEYIDIVNRTKQFPDGKKAVGMARSFRSRCSDCDELDRWLVSGAPPDAYGGGADLASIRNFIAPDHDGKNLGQKFTDVALNNKKAKLLGLTPEKQLEFRKVCAERMGVTESLKLYVYGWHYELLVSAADETFADFSPSIRLLAKCINRSNLYRRMRMRPPAEGSMQPDHASTVRKHGEIITVKSDERRFADDKCELAVCHAIELAIPMLFLYV